MGNSEELAKTLSSYCMAQRLGFAHIPVEVVHEVMAILKELEPVEPKKIPVDPLSYDFYYAQCGNCGHFIPFIKQKYCHECGRAVKWDAAD